MKLFYSATSPYVRKVTIAAVEKGLDGRIERVPITVAPHQPSPDFGRRHNPLMKVPTLVRDDGSVLYDSIVICEYLDSLGEPTLFPPSGEARWDALRRNALADGLLDAALLLRYETLRPAELHWPAWIEGQRLKIELALAAAEQEAASLPQVFDIGQVALACALGYLDLRFGELRWRSAHPALAAWFAVVSERPSVRGSAPPAA
jgi:glutathione S-transferase